MIFSLGVLLGGSLEVEVVAVDEENVHLLSHLPVLFQEAFSIIPLSTPEFFKIDPGVSLTWLPSYYGY